MGESSRQAWIVPACLCGAGYALVGILFAVPATHVQAWRLAAWIVCALGYAAHILYERLRPRTSSSTSALHVAAAVALGAFALAVSANIHSLSVAATQQHPQLLRLSLVIWPIMTAAPAFLVALGANTLLARLFGDAPDKSERGC